MRILSACVLAVALVGCPDPNPGGHQNQNDPCQQTVDDLPTGAPDGHPDPLGARAAGEARAARITEASWIVQPRARQRVRLGDFLLVNDRVAVYVEDGGHSDGYARFGGEILAVDAVGEDGRPRGLSTYGETLHGLSNEMIEPHSITVLADGSDGGEAVIRVVGTFQKIPFLTGSMEGLFSEDVGLPGYLDYRLAPGEARLRVGIGILNNQPLPKDLSLFQLFGFLHYSRTQKFTAKAGYDDPKGGVDWVAFDGGEWGFLWRQPGARLTFGIEQSGFALFLGAGPALPACTLHEDEYFEIIGGGPEIDGVLAAARAEDGDASWRALEGALVDAGGAAVPGAFIHVVDAEDTYLTRTRTDEVGAFTVHVPAGATVTVVPQLRGYPAHPGQSVAPTEAQVALAFGEAGLLAVTVTDASTLEALPSRIQVIPDAPLPPTPASYGVADERGGRLHQHFDVDGEASLRVPTGGHRVVVSRGFAYELVDVHASVDATAPTPVAAALQRSVDHAGYLCADFHVHTHLSPDSNDPVERKVAGMVADGLDLPVFSDHEWVTAPQPVVEALGLQGIATGITSSELTTFEWGHFGIVPLEPQPEVANAGAIDWVFHSPAEVFDLVHARPEAPLIIVNHPRSISAGGYFSAAGLQRETVSGNALWSDQFDLVEAFNGSDFESNRDAVVQDWFALLNAGWVLPVVGSSDNHHLRTGPTGWPRSCLYVGHDDPSQVTPADVREALLSGDVFVSGGLYVNLAGPGGERLGETIQSGAASVTLTVTVLAASWVPADTLEIIVNGETTWLGALAADPAHTGPGQRFRQTVSVPVPPAGERTWVIAHATGSGDLAPLHPGKRPFGVTNPIYLQRP